MQEVLLNLASIVAVVFARRTQSYIMGWRAGYVQQGASIESARKAEVAHLGAKQRYAISRASRERMRRKGSTHSHKRETNRGSRSRQLNEARIDSFAVASKTTIGHCPWLFRVATISRSLPSWCSDASVGARPFLFSLDFSPFSYHLRVLDCFALSTNALRPFLPWSIEKKAK